MSAIAEKVHESLNKLQHSSDERFIVFRHVPCGLGGQVTGRVQTLCLALMLGRKAVFMNDTDPPYVQTFQTLTSHVPSDLDLGGAPSVTPMAAQADKVVAYDPMNAPIDWHACGEAFLKQTNQRLGLALQSWLELEGHIFNWMRLTQDAQDFCNAARQRLGISPQTLGVHFRRGDKAVETAFVPASVFNTHIAALCAQWHFNSVFLASDSPYAPQEIALPEGVRLIFDTEEQRFNNANHKMLMSRPDLALQETRVAFKNIALLASCGGVIGQDNAHFATLSGASILARTGEASRLVLIDGRIAEKNSPALALFFRLKKSARALARKLLPWMTAQARMK